MRSGSTTGSTSGADVVGLAGTAVVLAVALGGAASVVGAADDSPDGSADDPPHAAATSDNSRIVAERVGIRWANKRATVTPRTLLRARGLRINRDHARHAAVVAYLRHDGMSTPVSSNVEKYPV